VRSIAAQDFEVGVDSDFAGVVLAVAGVSDAGLEAASFPLLGLLPPLRA